MRILVVDDDEAIRQLLGTYFHVVHKDKHEVHIATDGVEGIMLAECHQPDIILLDIIMPGMDGFTVLERLKSAERTANIPVVLMSAACVREEDFERGFALGAAYYLPKPFNPREVLARLDTRQQALIMGHAVPMPVVVKTRTYGTPEFYEELGVQENENPDKVLQRGRKLLRGEGEEEI